MAGLGGISCVFLNKNWASDKRLLINLILANLRKIFNQIFSSYCTSNIKRIDVLCEICIEKKLDDDRRKSKREIQSNLLPSSFLHCVLRLKNGILF